MFQLTIYLNLVQIEQWLRKMNMQTDEHIWQAYGSFFICDKYVKLSKKTFAFVICKRQHLGSSFLFICPSVYSFPSAN